MGVQGLAVVVVVVLGVCVGGSTLTAMFVWTFLYMCADVCNKCAVCACASACVCVAGVIVRSTTAISPVGRWRTVCVDEDKGIKSWWHPDDKHPPAAWSYLSPQSCTLSWHDINNHLVLFLRRTTWRLQGGALCDGRCDVVNKFAAIAASKPQLWARTHASLGGR